MNCPHKIKNISKELPLDERNKEKYMKNMNIFRLYCVILFQTLTCK